MNKLQNKSFKVLCVEYTPLQGVKQTLHLRRAKA